MFLYGVYEPLSSMAFASLLTTGDSAIDVGAHYGDFTLLAAARVGQHGAVYAFEPQESVRGVLEANLKLNGLTHVRVLDLAVSDYEGDGDLHLAEPVETGQASLINNGLGLQGDTHRVQVCRLDDVLSRTEASRVTAIKVDVEGGEAAVLRGGECLLRDARPGVIFEVNGLTEDVSGVHCEAEDVLRRLGYLIYGLVPDHEYGFSLERVPQGQDPAKYCEPWLALNLLAVVPGSACEDRLKARFHLS